MSNRWRMRLALVATVLAGAALSAAMIATAHRPASKPMTRADKLALKNPLVVMSTSTMRVVRAVVNDRLFLIVFEKHNGVWFFSSSKPASELKS
jgi:hypothetical protein